jgi:copper homeostasis protein CutC
MIIETCVDTVQQAIHVLTTKSTNHKRRVELCSQLDKEGLTPTADMVHSIVQHMQQQSDTTSTLCMRIMIRPDTTEQSSLHHFVYNEKDIEWMVTQIEQFAQLNSEYNNQAFEGFVFGCLSYTNNDDLIIDSHNMKILLQKVVEMSRLYQFDYRVTFHKAFDLVCNSKDALSQLATLNEYCSSLSSQSLKVVDHVLTSGAEKVNDLTSKVCTDQRHFENINTLTAMNTGISIMPGGGVRDENVSEIIRNCDKLSAIHSSRLINIE